MGFALPSLPYAIDALQPHISRRTLAAHHGNHHAAYLAKTEKLTQDTLLVSESLIDIIRFSDREPNLKPLFNAAAQAWNHGFFWKSMRPGGGGEARGAVAELIEQSFGNQRTFHQQFVSAAGDQFGSGWAWLVWNNGRLEIIATSNAGTPLTTAAVPLLTLDVWEHAYYLDYQHRRLDYIAAFLTHLVNWDFANERLAAATRTPTPAAQSRR